MKHMDHSQGMDLKSMMDQERNETPMQEAMESPEQQQMEDKLGIEKHNPKGIAIEKVSIIGKKPGEMDENGPTPENGDVGVEEPESGEREMSDDELKELLSQLT